MASQFTLDALQSMAGHWSQARFPDSQMEHVALKASEEVGEVAQKVNALAAVNSAKVATWDELVEECADVTIVLMVLISRYAPAGYSLHDAIDRKLAILTDPSSGHRAAVALPR